MTSKERKLRIVARGEHSNHSHVITGECLIQEDKGTTYINVATDGAAVLRHLIESEWMSGTEVWTKEHNDIPLKKGRYEYVPQVEYDPYEGAVRRVLD